MVNKKYLFIKITSNLGQNVFSIFLLYSGFRINESFVKDYYIITLRKNNN